MAYNAAIPIQRSNAMDKYNELKKLVDSLQADAEKFFQQGNKAAGTRVRQGMQDVKTLAQEIRIEVQNRKNAG
jgi:uncharacterized protein YktA (UPF0223 family)